MTIINASQEPITRILFLCVANSTRSQMAGGVAREVLDRRVEVVSAGPRQSGLIGTFDLITSHVFQQNHCALPEGLTALNGFAPVYRWQPERPASEAYFPHE